MGGVLAIKALDEVDALPKAMATARAFAQEAAQSSTKPAAKPAPAKPTPKPAVAPQATVKAAAAAAAAAPAVCAPSALELAKNAGLSPAELQVLQSLGSRRTQLDQREQDIDTQLKLLAAAEAKLDARLKSLDGLKGEIKALLGEAETKQAAEVDRLVTVYSKMKPRDAAAVIAQLDDRVRIPVAAKMKETALAQVLAQMPPAEAKRLTESLARRYDAMRDLAAAAEAAANPQPAAAKPAAPKPKA